MSITANFKCTADKKREALESEKLNIFDSIKESLKKKLLDAKIMYVFTINNNEIVRHDLESYFSSPATLMDSIIFMNSFVDDFIKELGYNFIIDIWSIDDKILMGIDNKSCSIERIHRIFNLAYSKVVPSNIEDGIYASELYYRIHFYSGAYRTDDKIKIPSSINHLMSCVNALNNFGYIYKVSKIKYINEIGIDIIDQWCENPDLD